MTIWWMAMISKPRIIEPFLLRDSIQLAMVNDRQFCNRESSIHAPTRNRLGTCHHPAFNYKKKERVKDRRAVRTRAEQMDNWVRGEISPRLFLANARSGEPVKLKKKKSSINSTQLISFDSN